MAHLRSDPNSLPRACLSRTTSSPSRSPDTNIHIQTPPNFTINNELDLHLSTTARQNEEDHSTNLQLSIGSSEYSPSNTSNQKYVAIKSSQSNETIMLMELAIRENDYVEKAREEAKREILMAEMEFDNAKRIRQQAQAELERAQAFRENARKYMNSTLFQVTCFACKQKV